MLLLTLIALLLTLPGIENHALGEEIVEEIIKQADRFAFGFYIPYQEFVVKRGD